MGPVTLNLLSRVCVCVYVYTGRSQPGCVWRGTEDTTYGSMWKQPSGYGEVPSESGSSRRPQGGSVSNGFVSLILRFVYFKYSVASKYKLERSRTEWAKNKLFSCWHIPTVFIVILFRKHTGCVLLHSLSGLQSAKPKSRFELILLGFVVMMALCGVKHKSQQLVSGTWHRVMSKPSLCQSVRVCVCVCWMYWAITVTAQVY